MITTTPITLDLAQYDTHPILTWTLKDQDGAVIDLTAPGRTCELYVFEVGAVGNRKRTLWKATLAKSGTPTDGKVTFTPNEPTVAPYYPPAFEAEGLGVRSIEGWLRYHETGVSPLTHKWVKRALLVTAESAPPEPA